MLEKLATHEVESVTTLFSLADKCARGWWLRSYRCWGQQHQLQQRQLGARMRMASVRVRRVAMVVHAQFIPQRR